MQAIILAGGFATRLWPLTEKTPKPLLLLAGKPLISHITEKLPADMPIYVSVNSAFAADFHAWRKSFPARAIKIFIENAHQEDEKLGALFSVAHCIKENKINDDVLLLAGDNYFDFAVADFLTAYRDNPLIAVFDIGDREEAKKFGVVMGKNGIVECFAEKPEEPESTLISTGCSIIPRTLLADFCTYAAEHRDNLGGIFEHFLAEGVQVNYFSYQGKWHDIGSFSAFLEAHKELVGEKILEETGVQKKNVSFAGAVFLGANSKIENAQIENSVILSGAHIRNAEIRNSVIGHNVFLDGIDLGTQIIRDESFIKAE